MARKPVKYSVLDAFTGLPFKGNPAAVCVLEEERDDKWMQAIAAEFNLSETAYLTRIAHSDGPANLIDASSNPRFRLRWFTPVCEAELCGHATVAAAQTLFSSGLVASDIIEFVTLSGDLTAKKVPDIIIASASDLENGEDQDGYYIKFRDTKAKVMRSCSWCVNCMSFQDPVTGSAHCALASYWSRKLGKSDFNAYQASPRGGAINIHHDEQKQRVLLRGKAVTVMEGCILV